MSEFPTSTTPDEARALRVLLDNYGDGVVAGGDWCGLRKAPRAVLADLVDQALAYWHGNTCHLTSDGYDVACAIVDGGA